MEHYLRNVVIGQITKEYEALEKENEIKRKQEENWKFR